MLTALSGHALTLEKIKYGDFSQWVTREIKESAVLGGNKKTLYAIGPSMTLKGNNAYVPRGGTPWATSNAYAKVAGIVKGSQTVSPASINGNRVAKLRSTMEHVKALGIINMDVMVAGTIYLGRLDEPVSSTKSPYSKMSMGMPYTKRPKALVYDFRVDMPNVNTRVKATGLGSQKTLKGRDQAEVYILLQRRWEDAKGNIYAHRVGTGRETLQQICALDQRSSAAWSTTATSPANRSTSPIWDCWTVPRHIMPTIPKENSFLFTKWGGALPTRRRPTFW